MTNYFATFEHYKYIKSQKHKFIIKVAFKILFQSIVKSTFCPSNEKDYLSVLPRPRVIRERCDGKLTKIADSHYIFTEMEKKQQKFLFQSYIEPKSLLNGELKNHSSP